jgi:hypothetical protein
MALVQSGEALRKTFSQHIFFGDRSANVDLGATFENVRRQFQGAPSGAPPRINKPNRGFSR